MQDDLKVPYSEGADFVREVPTMGEHQAVCSQIHNIGHQTYSGEVSISPKVALIFEIDQKLTGGKLDGHQMTVSREFAMYFGKDNDFRKFIEQWKGKVLTDEEAKDFNLGKLRGVGATLIIVHAMGKGKNSGRTYANIAGIAPPKKDAAKVQVTYIDTPDWITKKKAAAVPAPAKHGQQQSAPPAPAEEPDLPF
jgi:hypothetical protein